MQKLYCRASVEELHEQFSLFSDSALMAAALDPTLRWDYITTEPKYGEIMMMPLKHIYSVKKGSGNKKILISGIAQKNSEFYGSVYLAP